MNLGQCIALAKQFWPRNEKRIAVLAGYRALGASYQLTLTDIALRNGVFATSDNSDVDDLAYQAGRRDAALEILRLAKATPEQLHALIETKPSKENRT